MSVALHGFNIASIALPNRGGFAVRRALAVAGGVRLGRNVRLATGVRIYDRHLTIGDDTWVGMDTRLVSCSQGRLTIGARCDIAPGCFISTGTHEFGTTERRAGPGTGEDVVIGDGCWIGMRVVILAGAHIGPGCIIAAGAVVPRGNYPPNTLIAGVPARVVRELGTSERHPR